MINCVKANWPDKLAGGVSLNERIANMQFLRDRIIETGICGGMDLGWNLKRGGPEISNDFVVHMINGTQHGIDVGAAYDDTSQPLRLIWFDYGPPDYGFPYYKSCIAEAELLLRV